MSPAPAEIAAWITSLPQPWKSTYEAGPTGFGLFRFLEGRGIECVVAAGDRVKTDSRDALHLARLLRLGGIVEVTVPSIEP